MGRDGFAAGVNLGGWISQYGEKNKEHFDTFITEQDIARIASFGMDHVRLPVDYPLIEKEGIEYVDLCLEWCRKHHLQVVLDLHKAPGYSFGTLATNSLFDDPIQQSRFISLWESLAKRYRSQGTELWFELLNEIVEPTSDRWNSLAHRTIKAIRRIDPTRTIVYGGNHYNSLFALRSIAVVKEDPNVVYTFHFYLPHLFTHQRASWDAFTLEFNQTVSYPGPIQGLKEFLMDRPQDERDRFQGELHVVYDRSILSTYLQEAVAFMEKTGRDLYCGEYGVIDCAPMDSRVRWHRDFVGLMRELQIGRAVWTYKEMNFGLINGKGHVVNEELIEVVSE